MKKSILLTISLLAILAANAQVVLLEEYFDNEVPFPPEGYTILDADGDAHNWMWDEYTALDEQYAVSESWDTDPLNPDNYFITPKIDLTGMSGTLTVRYSIGATSSNYYAEHYQLAVSTTDMDPASFTNIIHEETLPPELGDAWGMRIYDISEFLGQQIYITWRHYDCTDQDRIMLDSIMVTYTTNVGIPEAQGTQILIYPNPPQNYLTVSGNFRDADIALFSLTGTLVAAEGDVSKSTSLDVSTLAEGVYFLRVTHEGGVLTRKVCISR